MLTTLQVYFYTYSFIHICKCLIILIYFYYLAEINFLSLFTNNFVGLLFGPQCANVENADRHCA